MSTVPLKPDVALYIQRVKSVLHVRTDEELADRLAMAKQTVSSWRRRGAVPSKVAARILRDFGVIYPSQEDVTSLQFGTQAELTIAHAAALYCVQRYIKLLGRSPTSADWRRLGASHPYLVQAFAGYLGDLGGPVAAPEATLDRLLSEIDNGRSYYPFLVHMMANPMELPQTLPQSNDISDGSGEKVPQ